MFKHLREYRFVPYVKVDTEEDALAIAEALQRGGLSAMEIPFRTHAHSKAIREIAKRFPSFFIGAGNIMSKDQLLRAIDCQARFAFAPGVNPETIREANKRNIIFAPGVCSPSDIESALLNGSVDLQFFPAEQSGGINLLTAIIEPFQHLGLEIFAKGGIGKENAKAYLKIPQVAAVSASWIAEASLVAAKDWDRIAANAAEACSLAKEIDRV
ncbi:MAG: hypothetical protein A2X49_05625 [Lentisphaerae bacterium GWF2_52_8]|nr:MAG: hypothetical protein A2X49_05625 [Lentisphaerae bacterium GWF2_52_8]